MPVTHPQLFPAPPPEVYKAAQVSWCEKYRYQLTRTWGQGRAMVFVMLNPSTADATMDDPTIRRCMGFARREGCTAIVVVNLYGWRATNPRDLDGMVMNDAIGDPENARYLALAVRPGDLIVAAWGADPAAHRIHPVEGLRRSQTVIRFLRACGADLLCLGKTKAGHPRHPLYLPAGAPLVPL